MITKKPPKLLRAKGVMAGEDIGKPRVTYKVLRPLGEGQVQPYSAPRGQAWTSVHRTEIQRGEKFHEQPTYERNRLNWKSYVRAHVDNQIEGERKRLKLEGVSEPIEETRTRLHKDLTQKFLKQTQELYAGERLGKKQLRAATIRHVEGMMKRDREYMAGGLRQSRAIIRARGADPLLARAHPERMIEYKKRLEALTPPRQAETKSTRGFIVDQLHDIATRGSSVVAEEKDADWTLKRDKLHLHRQMLASPEYAKRAGLTPEKHQDKVAEADKALEEHFNNRRTKAEIRDQAKGTIGLLADKPVSHGGSPLSKDTAETIADILQKGNKSGKPITAQHVHRIKGHLDDLYERSASSGIRGVQKELLSRGEVFKRPLEAASRGYPHLGKLGLGLGLTGAVAAGLVVGRAVKRRQAQQQMSSRGRLIQFAKKFGDLPEEAKKILDAAVNKASLQTWKEGQKAAPNIVRSKRLRRRQALVKLKRKWGGEFLQKVLAHPDLPTHPNAPQWRKMFEHQRDINVLQKREQATHAHVRAEALKQQEEILGAQGKERAREEYTRGLGVGREQSRASAQARYEERAGELAKTMGEESDKRAGRLKWAATGTLAAGAAGGYALGRHDKGAHQRHEAMQALNLIRPPRQPREPKAPPSGVTINIGPGLNGVKTDRRKRTVQFGVAENIRQKLAGTDPGEEHPVHDIAVGALENTAAYPLSSFLVRKFAPEGSSPLRKWGVIGAAGGLGTGLAGIGLGRILRGTKTIKKQKEQQMSSTLRLIRFQQERQPDEGPEWLQKWAHRKLYGRDYNTLGQAQRVKKYAGRTHRLVRDLNIKRQGLPNVDVRGRPRKNEWEKPWVAGALTTAGLAGVIFGGKKAINFLKEANPQSRIGQFVEGFKRGNVPGVKAKGLAKVGEAYHGAKEELKRWRDKPLKSAAKYEYSKFDPVTGKMKSATQLEREAKKASTGESLQDIAARRKFHPWEKDKGEKGFRSLLKEIRFQVDGEFPTGKLPSRAMVARDRYIKQIHQGELERENKYYLRSAGAGAALGSLLRKKMSLGKAAGIGALAGLATQKAARIVAGRTKDVFGEESWAGKRIEKAPHIAGLTLAGGVFVKKAWDAREHLRKIKHLDHWGRPVRSLEKLRKLSSLLKEIRFEEPERRKRNLLAGAAVAATGIPLYKGAFKLARIGRAGQSAGRNVADYLEASQHILNQGVTGKLAGKFLRNPNAPLTKRAIKYMPAEFADLKTGGLNKISRAHFSAFRSSPTEALQAWSEEYHGVLQKRLQNSTSVEQFRKRQKDIVRHQTQSEKVMAHMGKLTNQGFNEREAIRHLANHPEHQELFKNLVDLKRDPVKMYTKQSATLAAIPATAGLGIAATTRRGDSTSSPRKR